MLRRAQCTLAGKTQRKLHALLQAAKALGFIYTIGCGYPFWLATPLRGAGCCATKSRHTTYGFPSYMNLKAPEVSFRCAARTSAIVSSQRLYAWFEQRDIFTSGVADTDMSQMEKKLSQQNKSGINKVLVCFTKACRIFIPQGSGLVLIVRASVCG